jgi:hypothetical protein
MQLFPGWNVLHRSAPSVVRHVHLSNSSTCFDGHFLTYTTLPVVKASRVFIYGQHTLV